MLNTVSFSPINGLHTQTNFQKDVREFFQFFKPEEIEELSRHCHHPLQTEILELINAGDWEGLTTCYYQNEAHFFSILDSLFYYPETNHQTNQRITDLTMGYMAILNSQCTIDKRCRCITYEEVLTSGKCSNLSRYIPCIDDVPSNQRYFFEVGLENLSYEQRRFITHLFSLGLIGGFSTWENREQTLLLSSDEVAKKDTRFSEGSFRHIHRMPKDASVTEYVSKGEHVLSEFHPKDTGKFPIHNASQKGLLSKIHDRFHTTIRCNAEVMENQELLRIAGKISSILKEHFPSYQQEILSETFVKMPTPAANSPLSDRIRFVLREIRRSVNDGECGSASDTVEARLADILQTTHWRSRSRLPESCDLDFTIRHSLAPYLTQLGYEITSFDYLGIKLRKV